ncbi:MAG: glycosyltransferase [Armatimonadetes bacterium]|nr:glycosyltransferase [Armatimonadota bacterium]
MRIAIFSECYTPVLSGVVTSVVNLREALIAMGHTVYVFAPGTLQPDDDEHIFRLPELPFPKHPYHLARPFQRLNAPFAEMEIDVIHCQHPFTIGKLGAETAKKYDIPLVYTVHSHYNEMAAAAKSPLLRTMAPTAMMQIMKSFCNRSDCVITPSRHTRETLRAEDIRANYAIIPSGVQKPIARQNVRQHLRATLGLADDTPLLLYLGRLGPEKRVDLILESVAMLRQSDLPKAVKNFKVVLVGDGQCKTDLEVQARELGIESRVTFAGTVPHAEVGDWYAASDLFVFPSGCETQGMVLIEAMAMGLPCITINHGGACEMVANGETGFLINQTCHALTKAIHKLLMEPDLCRQFGEAGKVRAERYTPEAMATKVLEVYAKAIDVHFNSTIKKNRRFTLDIRRKPGDKPKTRRPRKGFRLDFGE